MPLDRPKDLKSAPLPNPDLWADVRPRIKAREPEIMAPLTPEELQHFLTNTSRSSPGLDGVQYNVLRFLCYDESLHDLDIRSIILCFLNHLLGHNKILADMKSALLIFIHKFTKHW